LLQTVQFQAAIICRLPSETRIEANGDGPYSTGTPTEVYLLEARWRQRPSSFSSATEGPSNISSVHLDVG
jgi:hypothetical protein